MSQIKILASLTSGLMCSLESSPYDYVGHIVFLLGGAAD